MYYYGEFCFSFCKAKTKERIGFGRVLRSYYHVLRGNWGAIFSREMQYSYDVFPNLLREKDRLGIREISLFISTS
jgi:hypothetical protein